MGRCFWSFPLICPLTTARIDCVVLTRNRQFDLLKVLAVHPHLLGLGVDEGTAVVVTKERADVIGQSYVAVYNSSEWWASKARADGSGETGHDPFFLLRQGQALDLVSRLPVGGEAAGAIEGELMRAILSNQQLVVAVRQRGFQQLLLHLQMVSTLVCVRQERGAAVFQHQSSLMPWFPGCVDCDHLVWCGN